MVKYQLKKVYLLCDENEKNRSSFINEIKDIVKKR